MELIKKFLEEKNEELLFVYEDEIWIAIKPICNAININYINQFKNIQKDSILFNIAKCFTTKKKGDQRRKRKCLPESYLYGWIFSIKSKSKELHEFKKICYKVLYEHFKGLFLQ